MVACHCNPKVTKSAPAAGLPSALLNALVTALTPVLLSVLNKAFLFWSKGQNYFLLDSTFLLPQWWRASRIRITQLSSHSLPIF